MTLVRVCCAGALAFSLMGNTPIEEEEGKCCYTNPQFHGVCVVTPAEGETCAGILAYLNNPNSSGKNYCGSTKVRGGWKQVPCDETRQRSQCTDRALD